MHIDTVLKEIAKTVLISLPEGRATKVEDMLTLNEVWFVCDILIIEILAHKPKMRVYLKEEICVSSIYVF